MTVLIRFKTRFVFFFALLLGNMVAWPPVFAQGAEAQIAARVNKVLEGSGQVESVKRIKYFADLYEVVIKEPGSRRILYSNRSGSHVLLGSLVESKSMRNLTSQRMEALNRVDFERDLKPELALITVYGSGKRKLALFEDPRCTYCKKLRRAGIERLKDVTVYTYVYPILGPSSVDMAASVLCAPNPYQMWSDWMLRNQRPKGPANCNPPIQNLVDLGKGLGIQATPTIIFEDGTRVSGAIVPSDLQRMVVQASRRRN